MIVETIYQIVLERKESCQEYPDSTFWELPVMKRSQFDHPSEGSLLRVFKDRKLAEQQLETFQKLFERDDFRIIEMVLI